MYGVLGSDFLPNQKIHFVIFMVGHLLSSLNMIFPQYHYDFWIFDTQCIFAIATNILVLLMTAFVLQGHIL